MQPADVKCFNKVKGWHSKAVRRSVKTGETHYNIVSFMWDLPKIREEALDEITIQSGFSTPGLWPFNEQKAVDSMKVFEPALPPAHLVPSQDPINPHCVRDTLQGISELKGFIQDRMDVLSSSPARRMQSILEGASLTLKSAHIETQGYIELKQGLRDQRDRKTEWTGGNIKADIPVIKVGDALRTKNAKVAKKRQEKAETRTRQLYTRQKVLARKLQGLEIKIRKRNNLKDLCAESIAKVDLEQANAQKEYDKAVKQQADLQLKYDTEDRLEAERLEKLQMDPVLRYMHPDYGVLDPAILTIENQTQTDDPGTAETAVSHSNSFIIDTQGDRSVFDTQQDFITVPEVSLTAHEEHAFWEEEVTFKLG